MKLPLLLFVSLLFLRFAGYAQTNTAVSPVSDKIKNFIKKYKSKQQDVTIVLLDGSISTDMGYATKRPDSPYRPPCSTEFNIPSFIEEKLRWKGQQFRRYDASKNKDSACVFVESGSAVTQQFDSAWDWQNKPPVSNGYNGLTRILSGTAPSVSYSFPKKATRCDFIYRTDYLSSAELEISTKRKGLVQVYDEQSSTWKEADGYLFSAKEKDELIPGSFFPRKAVRRYFFQEIGLPEKIEDALYVISYGYSRYDHQSGWRKDLLLGNYLFS